MHPERWFPKTGLCLVTLFWFFEFQPTPSFPNVRLSNFTKNKQKRKYLNKTEIAVSALRQKEHWQNWHETFFKAFYLSFFIVPINLGTAVADL